MLKVEQGVLVVEWRISELSLENYSAENRDMVQCWNFVNTVTDLQVTQKREFSSCPQHL